MNVFRTSPLLANRSTSIDLRYFVDWHAWLWKPAVRAVIGDPARFAGRRVLELGCGHGKMSCLFALLGADVTALELPEQPLDVARKEVDKWNLRKKVSIHHYDGDISCLAAREYDFVFSKSVLVVVPDLRSFLAGVARVLRPDGRLLAVENMHRGTVLRELNVRARHLARGCWCRTAYKDFRGVTPKFLDTVRDVFDILRYAESYRLVAAIEAVKRQDEAWA
jgi:2-polyprenyl-3-methyl-5-hydroxy-6-metoxy-1,4-benzoquinol methylase